MGCAQSTVKDQVQDTAEPAADVAVPELVAAVVEETAEAAPASETPAVDEEIAATAANETAAEDEAASPAPVEEEKEAAAVVDAATAEEENAETTATAADEEVVAAAVEEEHTAVATEVAAEEKAAPEPEAAAAPAAADSDEAADVPAPAEPETEAAPVADETNESGLVFASTGVSSGDKGVVFYNFTGSNVADPAQDVKISKRFNDFKALHAEVAAIMANEGNVAPEHQDKFKTYPALPPLPKTSLFRSRSNAKQTEEREAQFLKILNAIARHPIAADSAKFKAFLA